jgi:uncharacterized protein with HEPN domain
VSSREWQQRVHDILDAIASIHRLTAGITFQDFEDDEAIAKTVLYNFVIIGKASRKLMM